MVNTNMLLDSILAELFACYREIKIGEPLSLDAPKIRDKLKGKYPEFNYDNFEHDLTLATDKLHNEGYIKKNREVGNATYAITFEGVNFIQNGGYDNKRKNDIAKRASRISVTALTIVIGCATVFVSYLQYRVSKIDNDNKQSLNKSRLSLQKEQRKSQLLQHQIDSLIDIVSKDTTGTK